MLKQLFSTLARFTVFVKEWSRNHLASPVQLETTENASKSESTQATTATDAPTDVATAQAATNLAQSWGFLETYLPQLEYETVLACFRVLTRAWFKTQLLGEWEQLEKYVHRTIDVCDKDVLLQIKYDELELVFDKLTDKGVIPNDKESYPLKYCAFLQAHSWLRSWIKALLQKNEDDHGVEVVISGDRHWLPDFEEDVGAQEQLWEALLKGIQGGLEDALRESERTTAHLKSLAAELFDESSAAYSPEATVGDADLAELKKILHSYTPSRTKLLALALKVIQISGPTDDRKVEVSRRDLAELTSKDQRTIDRAVNEAKDPNKPSEERLFKVQSRVGKEQENIYDLSLLKEEPHG